MNRTASADASDGVYGYTNRLSVRPGQSIDLHVSCEGVASYDASLVRLRHGFDGDAGPGFLESEVDSNIDATYPGRHFACQPGSYVEIDDPAGWMVDPAGMVVKASVYATLPRNDRSGTLGAYRISKSSVAFHGEHQAVMGTWDAETSSGWAITLENGIPTVTWSELGERKSVRFHNEVTGHHWYDLKVGFPAGPGAVTLSVEPVGHPMDRVTLAAADLVGGFVTGACSGVFTPSKHPMRIGALAHESEGRLVAAAAFNGKVGGVTVQRSGTTVARWHFGRSDREDGLLLSGVLDESANELHGRCFNAPLRAATGRLYRGTSEDFRVTPDEYDAIHFHDDDIEDARWPAALTLNVPEDLPSGVYAFRLRANDVDHHVPFFVGPGKVKNDVAVLFPTGTYLAYSNDRIAFEADGIEALLGHTPIIHEGDLVLQDHPEFGRSCYEIHNDGSNVVFSSLRRPLITNQPRYRAVFMSEGPWGLPADLAIVHWLETVGCDFDAITDEDLDRGGYELIKDYQVLLTGSHPEYVTRTELDALEEFIGRGGRLMYLGGNGFYATTSYDPENPHVVEIRRSDGGTRPSQSEYGERRHQTSGESAGLWRNRGKAPDRLVGVGMSSQGFDHSTYYERLKDSLDPRASFIFEGVGEDERVGDFGYAGGGAAGAEIDCFNPALGAPPGTLLLATSAPYSDVYLLVTEELCEQLPGLGGSEQPSVRADMVYVALAAGGGVFSVGSIAYTAALSHNNYDNNIARITTNVLTQFRDPKPLP